ncbi:hypothetical protein HMPREF3192_00852 [Atopobium deltae]|uniref:Uncharacterized protein n=1 Tax=Atopobium deltae TaxID=1393034 RepID=A0A133XU02_9ACTN|nr:hypothetical protein HMPREF3192_00852 [Atopobium deltae]
MAARVRCCITRSHERNANARWRMQIDVYTCGLTCAFIINKPHKAIDEYLSM